jgi:threonine synthase
MEKFKSYQCSLCGKEYTPGEIQYTCPHDGGNLSVMLDYEDIRKKYRIEDITSSADFSLWRYLPLLPVADREARVHRCDRPVGLPPIARLPWPESWA